MSEILCKCGCGTAIPSRDSRGRMREFVRWHAAKLPRDSKFTRMCEGCGGQYMGTRRAGVLCQPCYRKKYHEDNRSHDLALNAKLREKTRQAIIEEKSRPCMDCGKQYPSYVMDFDHVRGEKKTEVGKMYNKTDLGTVRAEMDKCDVVCSNCHRERTHVRKQLRIAQGLDPLPKPPGRKRIEIDMERLVELKRQGLSQHAITKITGLSTGTVYRAVDRARKSGLL